MYKFLVIGSNSFTGINFINYLVEKNIFLIGISRSNQPDKVFFPRDLTKADYKFYKLDINFNQKKIIKLIQHNKITHIVNFASQSMVAESWKNPLDWYQTNVISHVSFFEKIKNIKSIKKYVHVTTPEVYGNTKKRIKENFNFLPSTPYATSRAACDFHLRNLFINYKFPVVFTRAANVYGPGQQLYRLIPKTFISALTESKIELHGGGKSTRSFIYIDDVVDATFKIAIKGKIGEVYHISNNETYSIKKIIIICAKYLKIPAHNFLKIGPERAGKDNFYLLDFKKISKQLNWKPKVNINDGILATYKWVKKNLNTLKKKNQFYIHKK
jgi:dTDP-glucose 4,6-dehydratase